MKTGSFIYCIIFFELLSCNSHKKEVNADVITTDTVYDYSDSSNIDSVVNETNKSILWHADETDNLKLHKPTIDGIDTMSTQNIIRLINNNADSIHIDYVKTSHDTIFLRIPNSETLTERIGTTGAEMFMASTTFSLTEVKGIRYVNYDFVEGEHAAQGVYDRDYFRNYQ